MAWCPATAEPWSLNPVMPYYVFHNMAVQDADAIGLTCIHSGGEQSLPTVGAFDVSAPANYLDQRSSHPGR